MQQLHRQQAIDSLYSVVKSNEDPFDFNLVSRRVGPILRGVIQSGKPAKTVLQRHGGLAVQPRLRVKHSYTRFGSVEVWGWPANIAWISWDECLVSKDYFRHLGDYNRRAQDGGITKLVLWPCLSPDWQIPAGLFPWGSLQGTIFLSRFSVPPFRKRARKLLWS